VRALVPILTRLLSVLLGLALLVAGVVLVVEIIAALLGGDRVVLPDDLTERMQSWRWDDRAVVITALVIGAVGLLALLVGLWPRAPLTIGVDGDADVTLERRAVEHYLRRRVEEIDGVAKARVKVSRSDVTVRAATGRRHDPDSVKRSVQAVAAEAARVQGIVQPVRVRLDSSGGPR